MQVVVGVALCRAGRVLAAHRARPPVGWELPGGKVEAGEEPADAAVRELREELGCEVEVTGWLEGAVALGQGMELRVALAHLVSGEPRPLEHDALWWVPTDLLGRLDWLPADVSFVAQLG
ncbi:DNA mismatch repair protein MutT [Marmoricola endophyticus]|uniref:8-oxo-dGTP diphosphatase n=1 Tax=Marmoricola endophyticus TaxID=2040280 RepID=A0A917F740_9ACTN|nr:NUDIX domain-containing protein [Marmoricola endophyticus]GGF54790.1 DNA mismatch repair protein MutT [Marmoricola endophyticus]